MFGRKKRQKEIEDFKKNVLEREIHHQRQVEERIERIEAEVRSMTGHIEPKVFRVVK